MNTATMLLICSYITLYDLKRMLFRLSIMVTILAVPDTGLAEDRIYTVGIIPQFETKRIHKIWHPILAELEQHTGLRFELIGSPTIPHFEDELMSGKFDFAYMNPYQIMLVGESEGYIPLIRDVSRTLHGVLVVRRNSGIKTVEELNNKKVAFPSPNAFGASLQMRQELSDKFKINVDPVYVNTHDSVYLNVAIDQTAAGGGVQNTFNSQKPEIRHMLRVIHSTTPVTPHPFAAHPSVPKVIRDKVHDALITIGESDSGKQKLMHIPINQIGPASMKDYEALKEMRLNRFYISSN